MRIETYNFNRAAFFLLFKCKLLEIIGKYPDNGFVFHVAPWLLTYEKLIGFVPYKSFSDERIKLKRMLRHREGLPMSFLGSNHGFKVMDIARFSYDRNK